MKVRIKFSKHGAMKFIGHLDMMRYFQKAIRRAEIDIAYSGGFSPHQIMSFAAPLGVGLSSNGEYFDIEMNSLTSVEDIKARLNAVMAEGVTIRKVTVLGENVKNAMASVAAAAYTLTIKDKVKLPDNWQEELEAFYKQSTILATKQTKKNEAEIDLKPAIYELKVVNPRSVYLLLNASSSGNIKPGFVIDTFLNQMRCEIPEFPYDIIREETYGFEEQSQILIPLSELQ